MFGSQAKSLKNVILGEEAPPQLEFNKKRSRSVRIVKKDSRSIKTVRLRVLVVLPSPIFYSNISLLLDSYILQTSL